MDEVVSIHALEALREEKADIMRVARMLARLKRRGVEVEVTDHEWNLIDNEHARAQAGLSLRPIEKAHEIARWILFKQILRPLCEEYCTKKDREIIRREYYKLCDRFEDTGNAHLLAELVRICYRIGLRLPFTKTLSEKHKKRLEKLLNREDRFLAA